MSNMLNEKLSISSDVIDCQNHFIRYLKEITNFENDITFSYDFFGLLFKVEFKKRVDVLYPQFAIVNILNQSLQLFLDNDELDIFLNTVSHECVHIFQYAKNKQLYQNKPLYKKTMHLLKMLNDKDSGLSKIDEIFINALYASFDFEQDAMVHGLYTQFSNKHILNAQLCYQNSDEYLYLKDMENAIHLIDEIPAAFNEKLYRMPIGNYHKLIKRQFNRFHTKIDKMMQLIADNMVNEGLIHVRHLRKYN